MDVLQDQVATLHAKIDALHQTIEQLTHQMADMLTEFKGIAGERSHASQSSQYSYSQWGYAGRHTYSTVGIDSSMEHKDVLSDSGYPDSESQGGERQLSPEIQIQRLTAQLTAAYNRIAALEEQLLARRIQ